MRASCCGMRDEPPTGLTNYLHKPVNQVLLKARINSSLEKKRLRDQQTEMVKRFATSEVAADLQQSGFALGGRRVHGTVMFCDIRGFTSLVESQPPEETIELLNAYYALMFEAIAAQSGVVNQMIGGLMAIFGAPLPVPEPALAAGRLEAHTKVAGHAILIDGDTRDALAARLPTYPLAPVAFKGKARPFEVFVVG